jgi:hypothetical protein
MKTKLGNKYTEANMVELKKSCPNAVALGKGREYFEMMLDGLMIADKITKGLPPSSQAEAGAMAEARRMSENVSEFLRHPSSGDTLQ